MKPRMRYAQFCDELDKSEEIIIVGGLSTKEIVSLVIDYEVNVMDEYVQSFLVDKIVPQSKDDAKERTMIMLDLTRSIVSVEDDKRSRQMIIRPHYVGNEKLSACISLVHVLFRSGKVILNIYQRSQCIDNFMYDQQTFFLLAKLVANIFTVEKCEINIIIGSLHKYID